jgi:hypothetical protein
MTYIAEPAWDNTVDLDFSVDKRSKLAPQGPRG